MASESGVPHLNMQPERRIGFEVAIWLPCVILIILRAWVLNRYKRARFGNSVTNAALYLTCLCVIGTSACNIWTSSKLIQYRDYTDELREPSTGLPLHLVVPALKISVALKCFYVVGLYAVKAAFLGIFVELEQHLEKRLRVFVRVAIWVTVAAFVVNFLLTMLWCLPFHTNWSLDPDTLCSSLRSMAVVGFGTATNVLTDLAIMAIPLFVLKTLPLRRREMYAIAFILFLGLICIVASIVRFIFLWDFIYGDHNESLPSQQNIIVYTSELEVAIAVWAGCLPALRVLLRRPSRNGTTVSESGLPSSMFSQNGRGDAALATGSSQANKALDSNENGTSPFSPRPDTLNSPAGNPVLAKGFGYGGYDLERDSADLSIAAAAAAAATQRQSSCVNSHRSSNTSRTLTHNYGTERSSRAGNDFDSTDMDHDHKLSIDSERDGSEVELRNIVPLSPRGYSSRNNHYHNQYSPQNGGRI